MLEKKILHILLVEDDEVDVLNVRRSFDKNKITNPLYVAFNGIQGLEMLRTGEVPKNRRLVLLDLNMPRMNGIEFLRELRKDSELRSIPVVVLTTSASQDDIARAYSSHANCYITKPVDLDQFLRVVQSIESFWLSLVKLPPVSRRCGNPN